MATAVFFHAHPDDEAIITGGTMLLASRAGHRVVVVCATDGSLGLTNVLSSGERGDSNITASLPHGHDTEAALSSGERGDSDSKHGNVDPPGGATSKRVALDGDREHGNTDNRHRDRDSDRALTDSLTRRRLASVREAELRTAAQVLGVHRVEMLGYADSGMASDPANDNPECFKQADESEAARRLAAILRDEHAEVLTCYDDNGGYGHPDHIQVHRVGVRAAALAGVKLVYEATMDRDHFQDSMEQIARMADDAGIEAFTAEEQAEMDSDIDTGTFGSESAAITHEIDVTSVLAEKREAMVAHVSQIPPDSFFLALPDEAFKLMFATEWFIERGVTRIGPRSADIFAPLSR